MKWIKKTALFLLIILIIVTAYVMVNTLRMKSRQINEVSAEKFDVSSFSTDHFSRAIQIRTVSPENIEEFDSLHFEEFNRFLATAYPLTDSLLDHKTFNRYSHLYHWKGINPDLKPVILMGHLDVVPVIEENRPFWKEDPFGGEIIQDTIWGRGCIDDKIGVIGIMESVEHLLKEGFQPNRDIYLSFGHDEEIGGQLGARSIANYFREQGIKAEYIMDEGGSLTSGMVPGIQKDVALIGIAEKGSVSLELSVELEGGHSSMPARETAIDVLSGAIYKLKSNPFPAKISPPLEGFLSYLGPEMPFVNKMAFANKDLFQSMIISVYESSPSGNALVRTTTAPTIFNSGVKDNIIPLSAKATLNFRVISGSSIKEVVAYVSSVIDDNRIRIKEGNWNTEPSVVSDTESGGFKTIQKTIAQTYPEALVSPYLVVGATDARHFNDVSDHIYRFLPTKINSSNVKSFHGLNERIAVSEFESAIRFYVQLIRNSSLE